MAIQNRRGVYSKFDPTKMLSGEFAIVQSGDPNSTSGRALYVCIEPGVVKRVADYEDLQDLVADVAEGYIQDFDDAVDAVTELIPATTQAKNDANDAAAAANAAAQAAGAIVTGGNAAQGYGYGECTTAYSTNPKVVSISNFALQAGGIVAVQFTNGASSISSMNVNGTGNKTVKIRGLSYSVEKIAVKDIVTFMYDGTDFNVISVERRSPLRLNCGTISSLPATRTTNGIIKDNMICVSAILSNPSAQTSDWTVITGNDTLTIDGTISGSTDVTLVLEYAYVNTATS